MIPGDPRSWMWIEACTMIDRAEQLHRQFFRPGLALRQAPSWEAPVDVFETESGLSIIVALPGVEPDDLDVSLKADELLVAGVRRLPATARGAAFHRLEIPYGRFERRIRLPAARLVLDHSELVNGCLFLNLSKQL